jgi:hypothetical protein
LSEVVPQIDTHFDTQTATLCEVLNGKRIVLNKIILTPRSA